VVIIVVAALVVLGAAIGLFALGVSVTTGGARAEPAGTQQGPGDAQASYQRGQPIDIWYGSTWYAGRVLEVRGTNYKVSYDGWSSSWDEWVDATRLRARSLAAQGAASDAPPQASSEASFRAGDAVSIEWKGTWYKGRVLET